MLLANLFESSHFGHKYKYFLKFVPHKAGLFTEK